MIKSDSGKATAFLFFISVFIVLPLVQHTGTIDPVFQPRVFTCFAIAFLLSIFYLFRGNRFLQITSEVRFVSILLSLLLAWSAISIYRSVNPGDAFSEWLRMALLASLFLLCIKLFRNYSEHRMAFCRFSVIAVLIFSAFGFYQLTSMYLSADEGSILKIEKVLISTLANKNFFSEVMIMLLPLSLFGVFYDKSSWRPVFIIGTICCIVFIILTQSLAGWLAVVTLVVFLFAIINFSPAAAEGRKVGMKRPVAIILIFSIVAGLAIYSRTQNAKILAFKIDSALSYVKDPSLFKTNRKENNNSAFERMLIWRNTVMMISDHPALGVGLNNWKLLYPQYGIYGTDHINRGLQGYEHPHNEYLLLWAEQGIPGLIIYLLLFGAIIFAGLRRMKACDHSECMFIALCLSAVIAFLVLSFFSYPGMRMYSSLLLVIYFALILSRSASAEIQVNGTAIFIVISIFAAFGMIASGFRIKGEVHQRDAITAQLKHNYARMLREVDKAESWFYPIDHTSTPLNWYRGMAMFYSGFVKEAKMEYERALQKNPFHLRVMNDLGTTLEQSGEIDSAIVLYGKALRITPLFIDGNLNISAAYYNKGNIDSAYYYIDRVYGLSMSMEEEDRYRNYLGEILAAYCIIQSEKSEDSLLRHEMETLTREKQKLIDIYIASKQENKQFAKKVTDYLIAQRKIN